MRYFLIAGETSGDLHAAHLMQALLREDPQAEFRYYGGDSMQAVGGTLLCHYRHLAYMGFIPVMLHLRTILRGIVNCKRQIAEWRPDVVILVDYPGFNLKIARYVRKQALCPVYYYISPKIWAWKERRIRALRRDVDRLYSILPFEVAYFREKHNYEVTYVGNPTVDEVAAYKKQHGAISASPAETLVALLPGSRRQEIADNFSRMLCAVAPLVKKRDDRQPPICVAVAVAPAIPVGFYHDIIAHSGVPAECVRLVENDTYGLLSRSAAALVTSGTATLETALFGVPQVVCYYTACGRLVSLLRRLFLKVPYVSLVNLICGREIVPELIADGMTPDNVRRHLLQILPGGNRRAAMLQGYDAMSECLGAPGAPACAARLMVAALRFRP
ncbi:lipid-A-disaccharide synthase [Prevotella sp. MGM2]|jgi:lipid-A-disaccharide synthase|uniref:lipid-A-disaccharide synthase n=1 Tax=Prevotella sp. MGM2 TaxID=2033406 RepID=UPI000CEA45C4|nr:lipid-A-disaccharide synthase [Prevotella sp. MGM2]GAY30477.1 lipid-A-disaccharide synthase [Prevotella sp. MGM2]